MELLFQSFASLECVRQGGFYGIAVSLGNIVANSPGERQRGAVRRRNV